MTDDGDGYRDLMIQKRFLGEIEQGIRLANRDLINNAIPELNKDVILTFAVAVGRLRASYLQAAVNMSIGEEGDKLDQEFIDNLKIKREKYEEAKTGFEALVDAIEKGYIDVEGFS